MNTNMDVLALWAALTRRYSRRLRGFADERALPLIDAEGWALERFVPRSDDFNDSVHPSPQGYDALGRFIADELVARGLVPRGWPAYSASSSSKIAAISSGS